MNKNLLLVIVITIISIVVPGIMILNLVFFNFLDPETNLKTMWINWSGIMYIFLASGLILNEILKKYRKYKHS